MKLNKVTERIRYYPFEKERDRPILGYIQGDNFSVAIDAGHSEAHTMEFYSALREGGLPLPKFTILTHWHWDHTFGMHAVNGQCIANSLTDCYLRQFSHRIDEKGIGEFLSLDECIRKEYVGNRPVIISFPDIVFSEGFSIDAGGCLIRLIRCSSPHTDDSTLATVEGERVLFLGDAAGGVYPTWNKNPELCRRLADTISELDVDICLKSHHAPQTKAEIIEELRSQV